MVTVEVSVTCTTINIPLILSELCLTRNIILLSQCIVEAVTIMDIICKEDPSYVYRAFPCVKALYGRLSGELAYARALIPIAQFYLNHSEC